MNVISLNQLDAAELQTLNDSVEGYCISMIMPIQQAADKSDKNRIRLKNLSQAAHQKLADRDFRRPDIESLLAPAEELTRGGRFVDVGSPGLAIYLASDFSAAYELPYIPEETVQVSSQFQIRPLVPLLSSNHYYILALSQQSVRLFRATPYDVTPLDLGKMPQNMEEALQWDDPEKQLQWHSQTSGHYSGRPAAFHGHGVGSKETHKENLLRYVQVIDHGVNKIVGQDSAPMVLVGIDYLLSIFRGASENDHIVKEEVQGSHESLSELDIQLKTWPLVEPIFQQTRTEARSQYYLNAARDLAFTDLKRILIAAHQGRVDSLFVALDGQEWGQFEPANEKFERHPHPQDNDVELLNLATIYTLSNKGTVYAGPQEELPDSESAAAILRFSL